MKLLYAASTARHLLASHMPLLGALKGEGWDITIACRDADVFSGRFGTLETPFEKSLFALENIKALRVLRDEMRRNNYDIVSTHTALAGAVTRAALMLTGNKRSTKCIHTAHGYLFGKGVPIAGKLTYLFEYACKGATDVIIVMNKEDAGYAKRLVRRGGEVIFIQGMGYDAERYYAIPQRERSLRRAALGLPGGVLLFYAAEFSKRKNHKTLIQALPRVIARYPDVRLLLAGDGRTADEMNALTARLGLTHNVLFLGFVEDTAPYLQACDGAVSPSLSEGMPLGVLEALACGLPIALSRVKGHVDIPGVESPLLFDPRDIAGAADACVKLVASIKEGNAAQPLELLTFTARVAARRLLFLYNSKNNVVKFP